MSEGDDLEISDGDHLMTPIMKMKRRTYGSKQRAFKQVIRSNRATT